MWIKKISIRVFIVDQSNTQILQTNIIRIVRQTVGKITN